MKDTQLEDRKLHSFIKATIDYLSDVSPIIEDVNKDIYTLQQMLDVLYNYSLTNEQIDSEFYRLLKRFAERRKNPNSMDGLKMIIQDKKDKKEDRMNRILRRFLRPSSIMDEPATYQNKKKEETSDVNITFTPGRVPSELDYITIWSGDVTENDLYKLMKDHNLPNLSHCSIGLRSDDGHPSLKFTSKDPNLVPDHITCFNGCEIHLSIPVECIRQDRYRTIYSFKGDPFSGANIVQDITKEESASKE